MQITRAVGLISIAASLLAGCGGGGSDAPPPAAIAPATTNVFAAYAAFVRQPHMYSLSGSTSTGANLTATLSVTQSSQVTSNGITYDRSLVTASIYSGGVLQGTGVTTSWLNVGSPNWVTSFESADGSCIVRTGGSALPTSAALNQTGPYLTGARYAGCNPGNLPMTFWLSTGAVTQTWSYSLINGIAFVCINSSDRGFVGTSTESICAEVIDANGMLGTRLRVTTMNLNGVTTTLSN